MRDVAVVIPCYNLGRYVEEAVDSVIAQTRQAAEIVVVDDGSPDPYTRHRIATLSRPRLKVAIIEHRGAAGARNHGVSLTSSPYLLFLDGDDALDPTYLEKTGSLLDGDHELDFVSTAMRGFGEACYDWMPPPPDLVAAFTRGTIPITALMRRSTWDVVGGFDETLLTSMDLDFWISALEHGFRGRVVDEPLLLRRVRSDSLHHAAVGRGSHWSVLETILRKHRDAVDRIGPELLVAKETFVEEQKADRARLERSTAELRAELADLDDRVTHARRLLRERGRPVVDLGDLRRVAPLSARWGLDRGKPVDRHFIERFLAANASDVRGRVLEIKEPLYTDRYGSGEVTAKEVLDIAPDNADATIVADLTRADSVPSGSFDCFILTQTLHIVDDPRAAVYHAHRVLAPGGVLLATLPAVSRLNNEDGGPDQGRYTEAALRRLLAEVFPAEAVEVTSLGNLKACIAFLYGLALEELDAQDLERDDARFPVVLCVRAVKAASRPADAEPAAPAIVTRREPVTAAILMYHKVGKLAVDPHGLCVGQDTFREHMRFLARRYRVLPLDDLADSVLGGDIPDEAVAVTFDDGTLDALEIASPVLAETGVPATFFVNTERFDEAHEPWWEVLARVLLGDERIPRALEVALGDVEQVFATHDIAARAATYAVVHRWLMRAPLGERERVMSRVDEWSGMDLSPRDTHRVLLPAEVRALADRPGHAIGCHTAHHLWLPSQPSAGRELEIRESKQDLERALGRAVTLFSYPYGGHDAETVELVRAAGFVAAVTTEPAVLSTDADVLALPRLDVKARSVAELAQVIERAFLKRTAAPR